MQYQCRIEGKLAGILIKDKMPKSHYQWEMYVNSHGRKLEQYAERWVKNHNRTGAIKINYKECVEYIIKVFLVDAWNGYQSEMTAINYFENEGFEVMNSSDYLDTRKGIDLIAVKGDQTLYISVKGTRFKFSKNGEFQALKDKVWKASREANAIGVITIVSRGTLEHYTSASKGV